MYDIIYYVNYEEDNMKLYNISVGEFINLLEHAKGNVFLVTGEGISFGLNSKLAQLYGIKTLLKDSKGNKISPEIIVENKEDEKMFAHYWMARCAKVSGWSQK